MTDNRVDVLEAEQEDPENLKEIVLAAKNADQIIYAPGTGKAKNQAFLKRQEQVLTALLPYEPKLCCLCNQDGKARLQHPLSPAVRVWHLSPLKIKELFPEIEVTEYESKKKPKSKAEKAAPAK